MSKLLKFIKFKDIHNWSVKHLLENDFNYNKNYELVKIEDFLKRNKTQIVLNDDTEYKRVTIKLYNKGVFLRDEELGKNIGTKKQFLIKEGQFLLSKIDARNGAFGVVIKEIDNAIITGNFWTYDVDYSKINPYFLTLITTTKQFMSFCQNASSGTTGRHYLQEEKFLNVKIPLPSLEKQKEIVKKYNEKIELATLQEKKAKELESEIEEYLYSELGIEIKEKKEENKYLMKFVNFKDLSVWSVKDSLDKNQFQSSKFKITSLNKNENLFLELFRGKSPKYDNNSKSVILNQKCNRWNSIELEYAKKVNSQWLNNIDKKFFTKENDILINSTGDGTIGRASLITKKFENLLYDSHILLLRVNQDMLNPLFLTYFINSSIGQKQIEKIKSAIATKQTELGINNLKNIQFPLPPTEIKEQLIISPVKTQNQIANHIQNIKDEIKELQENAIKNREIAIKEFEEEIFNEA